MSRCIDTELIKSSFGKKQSEPNLNILLRIIFIAVLTFPGAVMANFSFQDAPLKVVIREVQEETGYFFLFRESQVADIRVTLESNNDQIFHDLGDYIQRYDLELSVDQSRQQAFITTQTARHAEPQDLRVQGQVVDASTGERLPFATLTWQMNGETTGVAANASGQFDVRETTDQESIDITVSFIGYQSREISVSLAESPLHDLTLRLTPEAIQGNEIVVSGFTGYNPADTLLNGMIDAGRFSPLGESNSIRALQAHPAVSKGTALNNGISVRGSSPDGFLVLLDGMSIFNQSHLYGLLDSFNSDAVQSSGFYYGITPANIESPTGGSLNLITRTGSLNEFRNTLGISNTSVNGTFEGPAGDRSSWMISARSSYMDLASWFNNTSLIQWGLDINRPKRVASNDPDFTDLVLRPGDSSAQFVDLHGKLYTETANAGRFIFSGYFGGNRASQQAERRSRRGGTGGQFGFEEVETSNLWGNALFSIKYENNLTDRLYNTTMAGVSAYETEFEKDDFVYTRVENSGDTKNISVFTYPYQNRSVMNEVKLNQELEFKASSSFSAILGGSWRYYLSEYSEISFDRSSYLLKTDAHLADAYLQTSWSPHSRIKLNAGSRFYYYNINSELLYAPRFQGRFTMSPAISLTVGYSINHQFLHRVSIQNTTSADVWILSTREQPPASSTLYSAGIQIVPDPAFYFRAELYQKSYKNVRFHELNTQSLSNTFADTPWFFQNSGEAYGLELILRNRVNRFTLTQSYTYSEMMFQNRFLLGGDEFFADWDRTHSYNAVLNTRVTNRLQIYLSWLMMSGAPNSLATFGADTQKRLDAYYRLDLTLNYSAQFSNQSKLDLSFSIFNLLDHENVWYRTYDFNYDETRSIPRLRPVPVDVLDLGFQPSFKIQYSF